MFTIRQILLSFAAAAWALAAASVGAQETTFSAKLTGASELPEPRDTKATGELDLVLSPDGKSIAYKLTVAKIANAAEADLHLGPATANGPLVVKLFPVHGAATKKGEFSGVLAEGKFGAADLIGPMLGSPLQDLIDQIREGNTYTNVHTNDGMDPPNSGAGDYRVGEIRGQIK
jgi:hypothetical protein